MHDSFIPCKFTEDCAHIRSLYIQQSLKHLPHSRCSVFVKVLKSSIANLKLRFFALTAVRMTYDIRMTCYVLIVIEKYFPLMLVFQHYKHTLATSI